MNKVAMGAHDGRKQVKAVLTVLHGSRFALDAVATQRKQAFIRVERSEQQWLNGYGCMIELGNEGRSTGWQYNPTGPDI